MTNLREAAEEIAILFDLKHSKDVSLIESILRGVASKCPECDVKSLAQYQDKYGIVEDEWTKEQCLAAMRSIHYDRMDSRSAARAEAIEECAKIADGRRFYDPEGFLAAKIRALGEKK